MSTPTAVVRSASLTALLSDWPGVAAYEMRGAGDLASLHPAEAAAVADARAVRRREFAAGRACARRALRELGLGGGPLPRAADGRPLWPAGARGSIAHSDEFCVAAAMRTPDDDASLGVDVERCGRVGEELFRALMTTDERRWVGALSGVERQWAATAVFTIKEAFYKAQYPLTGALLDFDAIAVRPRGDAFAVAPARAGAFLTGVLAWPPVVKTSRDGNYSIATVVVCPGAG